MQTTQQLHTKVVLYLPEVLMGCWLALGAYSRVLDSIRCTLWRKSPTHPCLLRFGLHHSTVSAHKTKLEDIFQEHKLPGTNGRSVCGTRLDLIWSEEPRDAAQRECPALPEPRTDCFPGCLASQALHGIIAAASKLWLAWIYSSLHTVPLSISTPQDCW